MVRTLRRALLAVTATVVAAGIIRLRGTGGTPPRRGGWRELSEAELGGSAPAGSSDER